MIDPKETNTLPAPFLLVAQHTGPYRSIEPLGAEFGEEQVAYVVDGVAREERSRRHLPYIDRDHVIDTWGSFENMLERNAVKAIIRSTSEEATPDNIEILATRAAVSLSIPVFVVEDFPGNYWPAPEEPIAGLFVEDDSIVEIYRSRGVDQRKIFTTGNPRYDGLQKIDREHEKVRTRNDLDLGDEPTVLWAGQPDGNNSYFTLKRLLENYPREGPTLLFRAHPRDQAYRAGKYGPLISARHIKVIDVSDWPDNLALCCASELVVTQFSSAAVEASYLDVPALFVLFEDLGRRFLRDFKGYDRPPWCEDNCAFIIEREEEITEVMRSAIFDEGARSSVQANFRHRFGRRKNSAKLIADRIRAVVGDSPREVVNGL